MEFAIILACWYLVGLLMMIIACRIGGLPHKRDRDNPLFWLFFITVWPIMAWAIWTDVMDKMDGIK